MRTQERECEFTFSRNLHYALIGQNLHNYFTFARSPDVNGDVSDVAIPLEIGNLNYDQNGHKSYQNGHIENPKRPQTKTAKTKTATSKSIHQNGEHVNTRRDQSRRYDADTPIP